MSEDRKPCPICGGSGKVQCWKCEGKGRKLYLFPRTEVADCIDCGGSGRADCYHCSGKRTVPWYC